MPEIAREGKFILRVYARREHPPPHVHVYFDDTVVRISLYDLRVLDSIDRHLPKQLFEVVKKHRKEALQVWKRLNEKGDKR